MLLAVAEKEFARGNVEVASALFAQVAAQDPKNAKRMRAPASRSPSKASSSVPSRNSRARARSAARAPNSATPVSREVALQKGDLDGAVARAGKAGDSGYADVIRGEVALRRNQPDAAREAFQVASAKPADFGVAEGDRVQQPRPRDREPRATARRPSRATTRRSTPSRSWSRRAATRRSRSSVRGGQPRRRRRSPAPRPSRRTISLVGVLLKRLEERDREKTDVERQKLIDKTVDDLFAAYKSGKPPVRPEDDWSPRALVVSFIDLQDRLGPLAPDGRGRGLRARPDEPAAENRPRQGRGPRDSSTRC